MLRALAVAALAIVAVLTAAASGAAGPTDPDDARCRFEARANAGETAISFRVRCNFEPQSVKLRPSTGVRRVRAVPVVKPAGVGDGFGCARALEGKLVHCVGHMEDGARLKGRFRPRGEVCDTRVPYSVGGGVDCDPGEACISISLGHSGEVRRPRGC